MKTAVFFIMATLLLFAGGFSLFAAGVPEMESSSDTLLCIPENAVKDTGNDEDAYIEDYKILVEGPERATIVVYPGGTRTYRKNLQPGNYTAVEFSSVNKESGTTTASRAIDIPFTIRRGYITIFPAEVVCKLTKVYGALRQSGEINMITSSEARSILNDVKSSSDSFAWSWDDRSYEVPRYASGASLAGSGVKQAQLVPESSTPTTSSSTTGGTPSIAVMDFGIQNAPLSAGLLVGDIFEVVIHSTGNFELVERGKREAAMRSAGFDPATCTDPSCHGNAARAIEARQYVSGTLTKIGSRFMLNVSRIDARNGTVIRQFSDTFNSFEGLFNELPGVVEQLAR